MTAHIEHDIARHVKTYIAVFVALLVLTLVTVAVSWVHVSGPIHILAAMAIALVKGTLVAYFFMHLKSEKKLVFAVLILAVVFFTALMTLPVLDVSSGSVHL